MSSFSLEVGYSSNFSAFNDLQVVKILIPFNRHKANPSSEREIEDDVQYKYFLPSYMDNIINFQLKWWSTFGCSLETS